jgi:hypothetical protein
MSLLVTSSGYGRGQRATLNGSVSCLTELAASEHIRAKRWQPGVAKVLCFIPGIRTLKKVHTLLPAAAAIDNVRRW